MRGFELGSGRFLGVVDLNRNTIKNVGYLHMLDTSNNKMDIYASRISMSSLISPLTIETSGTNIIAQVKSKPILELAYNSLLDGQSGGNYVKLLNARADGYPAFYAVGSATDVGLCVVNKGVGEFRVYKEGISSYLALSALDATNINVGVRGSEANINLRLSAKGTGSVYTDSSIQGAPGIKTSFYAPMLGLGEANSYNMIMAAYNDAVQTLSIFTNGTTRDADGGRGATTIRNDNGKLILGSNAYTNALTGYALELWGTGGIAMMPAQTGEAGAAVRIIKTGNPAIDSTSYSNCNLELRTNNGSSPILGFHRSGYDSVALYQDTSNGLRIRISNTGEDGKILTDKNYDAYLAVWGNFTLDAAWNGKRLYQTHNGAVTVTIPSNLPAGFRCAYYTNGSGAATTFAGSGVTIYNADDKFTTSKKFCLVDIFAINTSEYFLTGIR